MLIAIFCVAFVTTNIVTVKILDLGFWGLTVPCDLTMSWWFCSLIVWDRTRGGRNDTFLRSIFGLDRIMSIAPIIPNKTMRKGNIILNFREPETFENNHSSNRYTFQPDAYFALDYSYGWETLSSDSFYTLCAPLIWLNKGKRRQKKNSERWGPNHGN